MLKNVIVVGAGVIGASIAYNLARDGHAVRVVDKGLPAAGVSGRSFGWINASFYVNAPHHALRAGSMRAWRQLSDAGVTDAVTWCGCLCWENSGPALSAQHAELRAFGYPAKMVTAKDIQKLCPNVPTPAEQALWFPTEGAADTVKATKDLLNAAIAYGAEVTFGLPVEALVSRAGHVCGVMTPAGRIEADIVVLATGTQTPELADQVGLKVPLVPRPGGLLWTKPVSKLCRTVLVAPEMEFRQLPDGRFLAPTIAGHQSDTTPRLASDPHDAANKALRDLRRLSGIDTLELEAVAIGWRPVPQDGLPVLGPASVEGLYIAVMHSGVTLAAIAGEIAAADLKGEVANDLAPFRPGRYAAT